MMQGQGSGVFGGTVFILGEAGTVNPLDTGALDPLGQARQREVGSGSLGTQQAVGRE